MINQKKAIKLLTGMIKSAKSLPILSYVNFEGKQATVCDLEAQLSISGFNGVGVIHKSLLTDAPTFVDGNTVTIKGIEYTNADMVSGDNYPTMECDAKLTGRIDRLALLNAIEEVKRSMAKQDIRYYLNGALLKFVDGNLKIVSTDGHRMSFIDIDCHKKLAAFADVIVPRDTILLLEKVLKADDNDYVFINIGGKTNGNRLRFHGQDWNLISMHIEGKFPDYTRVIPKHSNSITLSCNTLLGALTSLKPVWNAKYHGVQIDMMNGTLSCSDDVPNSPVLSIFDGSQHNFKIGFNADYLMDCCASITDETITIKFLDASSSILINDRHIIMPMRL